MKLIVNAVHLATMGNGVNGWPWVAERQAGRVPDLYNTLTTIFPSLSIGIYLFGDTLISTDGPIITIFQET